MYCKIFNCDRKHGSICCARRPDRGRCRNPCLNSPDRCGQSREATPREKKLAAQGRGL